MTPDEEAVRRAQDIERALKIVDPAFDGLLTEVTKELFATSPVHTDKILRLQAMGQAINAVRGALQGVMVEGALSRDAIAATGATRTGQSDR